METPIESYTGTKPETTSPKATIGARGRFYAFLVLLGCLGILALAAWLQPDPKGYGTHRQLGFGKCGMLITTGLPCPTCGMTTAFAYTVRGRLFNAFMAQPAGLALALATIGVALGAAWTMITGKFPKIRIPYVTTYRLLLLFLVLLIGGWGFKIVVGLIDGSLPDRG